MKYKIDDKEESLQEKQIPPSGWQAISTSDADFILSISERAHLIADGSIIAPII